MIRILLVDDQNLVQQGIKSLLDRNSEFKVVGTVTDGRIAVKHIDAFRPDVVLLDIEMPGMDGITATKYISRLSPKTKVIILSSHEDKKYVTQALMAGAKGYILKSSLMTDLKQSIIAVSNGYSQIESRLLAKVFDPSNIKSRSKESAVVSRKRNNSDAIETIAEPRPSQSVTPQTRASASNHADSVVLSKPDLSTITNSIESNQADSADLKPVTVVSRMDLVKSMPLTSSDTQINDASYSEADEMAKSSEISVANPLLPAVIVKRSTTEISSSSKVDVWNKLSKFLQGKIRHIYSLADQPQLAKFISSRVKSYRTKLVKHWYQVSPIIKQWHRKGWLANAGVMFLGVVTVLIIHFVFF